MRMLAVLLLAVALAGCGGSTARPELQRELDALASPGATAYVIGPHGTWSGAAGYANLATKLPMQPDARLRLESVSKLWTATVIVKLVQEKRLHLDDTLARWWPSMFRGAKRGITIRQLLNHTSGLLDNNDLGHSSNRWLAATHDPKLRADLVTLAKRLTENPSARYDDLIEIRWAAALPLLFPPGTNYHYSNIGYKIAGRIAERASGESLAQLYRRVIITPLRLKSAVYAPNGPTPGEHPVGYENGKAASRAGEGGLGAEGGIVSDARDEATFLVALVRGKLVPTGELFRAPAGTIAYALGTGITGAPCAPTVYTHNGGGPAWSSSVVVSKDGSRVAVVLVNGRGGATADEALSEAALRLFCRG